jgi:hypothetical protein
MPSLNRYTIACTVAGNALHEAKSGNLSCKIVLQVTGDTSALTYHPPYTLYADLWLTDAAVESSLKTLRNALGWDGTDSLELNEPIFQGATVDAVVDVEEYYPDGATGPTLQHKVAFLNAPGAMGAKKLDEQKARSFAAQLNAKISRLSPGGSAGARPALRPTPQARGGQRAGSAGTYDGPEPPVRSRQGADLADYM